MGRVTIKDIAVVSDRLSKDRYGKAPDESDDFHPMTKGAREVMLSSLFASTSALIELAHKDHLQNSKKPGSQEVDLDYITRLSTNEFYFYTEAPLTLNEFERLMNILVGKMKTLPPGIQLILGSFAVKDSHNHVMNVTPHISSGTPPSFTFLVKNYTSTIDVKYKNPEGRTYPILRKVNWARQNLPKIHVAEQVCSFTFNTLVQSESPNKTPFLTAVDICIDHREKTAKNYLESHTKREEATIDCAVSHIVISNSVELEKQHSVGQVMHVDPLDSIKMCKAQAKQTKRAKQIPGKAKSAMIKVNSTPLKTQREILIDELLAKLESLKFGETDEAMTTLTDEYRKALETAPMSEFQGALALANRHIASLKTNKPVEALRKIIGEYRAKASPLSRGMLRKATYLETRMAKMSLEERARFTTSDAFHDVMKVLASHRHLGKTDKVYLTEDDRIDHEKASTSFKNFKKNFRHLEYKIKEKEEEVTVEPVSIKAILK